MTKATLVRRPRNRYPERAFAPMDRLFEDFFSPAFFGAGEGLTDRAWQPAVDVRETDESYQITADLPGLTKSDIEITFDNGVLSLKGERQFEEETENGNIHRLERRYGSFSRSFVLPTEVDSDKTEGKFKNGVLTISLPKAERARSHKIAIH